MEKCKIKTVNGQHWLFMPDGKTVVPCVVWTRVTDIVDEPPRAIVQLLVDLE